jgi:hypothetical protein
MDQGYCQIYKNDETKTENNRLAQLAFRYLLRDNRSLEDQNDDG